MQKYVIDHDKIKRDCFRYFNRCLDKITCRPFTKIPFHVIQQVMNYIESNDIQHINYNLIQKIFKILDIKKYCHDIPYFTIMCLIKFEGITEDDLLSFDDKCRIRKRFEDTWANAHHSAFGRIYMICRELKISDKKIDILVKIIHVPLKCLNDSSVTSSEAAGRALNENIHSDEDIVKESCELSTGVT